MMKINACILHLLFVVITALLSNKISTVDGKKHVAAHVEIGNHYQNHDPVHIIVNKVGPFQNPSETYRYYSLPFCRIHQEVDEIKDTELHLEGAIKHGHQRLGQSLVGDDAQETSPYQITFLDVIDHRLLCTKTLTSSELTAFKKAITNYYFFEMFVEDLPMWGYVGEVSEDDAILDEMTYSPKIYLYPHLGKIYLYPHLDFTIGYNGDQIVAIRISIDVARSVDIAKVDNETKVEFSYSVEWYKEELKWKDRHSRYSVKIHWLSIISSFVLVLLFTACWTIILLQKLKKDFARYIELDDEALEEDESGWKRIHGDVFRFPTHARLFCAAVGAGNHLLTMTFFYLSLDYTGIISVNRIGSRRASLVVLYCLTSFVGGYTAVRLYRKMNGKDWTRCILLTALLFPCPVVCVFMWVNTVAMLHRSTVALSITAILIVLALFLFICLPFTIMGGSMAKFFASDDFNAPTKTSTVAREIPTEILFYRGRVFRALISGFLPFSAIYVTLHDIFASIWGYQRITLFGIFSLAIILLVVVTAFITAALVYFQLAREDHRWWWTAYVNGGMTGLFIYLYSFYYYFQFSNMIGMLQLSLFFGYMAVASFAFFLMLGSASFQFSLIFVRYIYSRIKSD